LRACALQGQNGSSGSRVGKADCDAAAGDRLVLGVTRFSWTSGKIRGACWGAAMSHPFIYRAGLLIVGRDFAAL